MGRALVGGKGAGPSRSTRRAYLCARESKVEHGPQAFRSLLLLLLLLLHLFENEQTGSEHRQRDVISGREVENGVSKIDKEDQESVHAGRQRDKKARMA